MSSAGATRRLGARPLSDLLPRLRQHWRRSPGWGGRAGQALRGAWAGGGHELPRAGHSWFQPVPAGAPPERGGGGASAQTCGRQGGSRRGWRLVRKHERREARRSLEKQNGGRTWERGWRSRHGTRRSGTSCQPQRSPSAEGLDSFSSGG